MTRRKSFVLIAIALVSGLSIWLIKPLRIAYCELTGTPQSWLERSSPLRSPIREVWKDWEEDGLENSEAVYSIAEIINRELPPGSSVEAVKEHIRTHYDRVNFHPMGARKELAFHLDAFGTTYPHESALLKVWYISYKDEFIGAEIHMGRFKGSDMHYIALNSESGRPVHIDYRKPNTEQAVADQLPARDE